MQGTALNGAVPASPTASSPYEYLKKIEDAAVASPTANSVADIAIRKGGLLVTKTNTCNGNGAQTDNIFTVTGAVEVLHIWGVCTEATNATVLSANSLQLWDSTAGVEITDADAPLDASGITAGSLLLGESAAAALVLYSNATGLVINDGFWTDIGSQSLLKKIGATTTIRHLFTGNADTDVDIKWYAIYVPLSDDGSISAA